jgi:hypothetical protein
MRQIHVATIQVAVDCQEQAQACDCISEMMREAGFHPSGGTEAEIYDWQYLKIGGQFTSPTEKYVADDYVEGGAFI